MYVGIDTTSGELVTISEWVLKWRHYGRKKILRKEDGDEDKEGAACLKQVSSVDKIYIKSNNNRHFDGCLLLNMLISLFFVSLCESLTCVYVAVCMNGF